MKLPDTSKNGFTLIELIVVMIILSILASIISGNFLNSLQKGRDAKRKTDIAQIQRALEIYYEDFRAYPTGAPPFGSPFCKSNCTPGDKRYMMRVPKDPNSDYTYTYISDPAGQYYYLLSCIENYKNDKGVGVNSGGYCSNPEPTPCGATATCGGCGNCKFVLSSPNAVPLTPMPTLP